MHAVRRRLRAWAWLALLSITALAGGPTLSRLLLPAVGPTLAAAVSHSPADPGSAVSAPAASPAMDMAHHHHDMAMAPGAMPGVPRALPTPLPVPAHEHALEHCGLCLLAAGAFAFVQERRVLAAFVECARPAARCVVAALPRLRSDWSPASSRGPPLLA
jgi:hypothetical protein